MRLDLTLGGSVVSFTPVNSVGAYPFLDKVSPIHSEALVGNPGTSGGARPSTTTASLDNTLRRVVPFIGNPERASAVLFDDDGNPVFTGFVASILYGLTVELRLQS